MRDANGIEAAAAAWRSETTLVLVCGYDAVKMVLGVFHLERLMRTTPNPTAPASVDSIRWGLRGVDDGERDRLTYLPGSTPPSFRGDFCRTGSPVDRAYYYYR